MTPHEGACGMRTSLGRRTPGLSAALQGGHVGPALATSRSPQTDFPGRRDDAWAGWAVIWRLVGDGAADA